MKIENDILTFEDGDLDGFSDPIKKALSAYLEDYLAYFSNLVNVSVSAAKQHAKNSSASAPSVSVVLESYAAADEAKRAAAESLLIELDNFLKAS